VTGTDRSPTTRWAGGVLLAAAVLGACGGGSPPGLEPGEAAAALARNLDLTPTQTDCMRDRFERAPGAAAVLATEEAAGDTDRDAFLVAIRACLPPEDFGATLASTVREELPEATEAQATCVGDTLVGLAPPEQDRLYLYFANPAALDVADVGQAGEDLLVACGLAGQPAATGAPETTATTATPAPP
jgi:hypothetical protein